jgi:uncharacterized protein YjbI with pentapeptide repeats
MMTKEIHDARENLDVQRSNISGSNFDDVNLSNSQHLTNVNASVCKITRANLSRFQVDDATMANSWFNNVNLSGSKIANANLSAVAIENCLYAGMIIDGVKVSDLFAAYNAAKNGAGSE